jgi:tetratricopeptide (TPR) repeat protein
MAPESATALNAGSAIASAASDGLAGHYSKKAERCNAGTKEKEAAMLFSIAEGHLNEDEDYGEAIRAAQDALALFRTIGDVQGESDALRLVVYAHRIKADNVRYAEGGGGEKAEAALDEAERIASTELEKCRKTGDKRSIGAMLLALAELAHNRTDESKREEAFLAAVEARGLLRDIGDTKLEAGACFILANMYSQKRQLQEAGQLVNEALALFRKLGDRKSEAKTLSVMATVHLLDERIQDAFGVAKESLAIFRELDVSKMLAYGLYNLASWYVGLDRPGDAVPHVEEALKIFEELKYPKCWRAATLNLLSHALVDSGQIVHGLKKAQEGVTEYQKAGDIRGRIFALDALANAHSRKDDHDEALVATEAGLAACRELGDKTWEAQMLRTLAMVHQQSKSWEKAVQAVQDAKALAADNQKEQTSLSSALMQVHVAQEDFHSAVRAAEEELDNAKQNGDRIKEARSLLALASIRGMDGDLDPAKEETIQALEQFQGLGDRSGEGSAQLLLADIHLAKEEFADGLAAASKALQIFKEKGNEKMQSQVLHMTAKLRMAEDAAPEIGLKAANEAVSLMKKIQDQRGEAESLILASQVQVKVAMKQGNAAAEQDTYRVMSREGEKALKHAQEAVKIGKKLKDNALTASAVYQCATAQLIAYRIKQALSLADDAAARFLALGDQAGQLASVILRAEILASDGQEDKARELVNHATATAKATNDAAAEYRAWELLQHLDRDKAKVQTQAGTGGAPNAAAAAVVDEAPGLDPAVVEKMVTEVANNAIGGDELALDSPLMDSGMDSLSSVAFRNDLQRGIGFNLPAALIFDYPTARQIVGHLIEMSKTKKK